MAFQSNSNDGGQVTSKATIAIRASTDKDILIDGVVEHDEALENLRKKLLWHTKLTRT